MLRRGGDCRIGYEEKEVLTRNWPRYFVRVITRERLACRKCPEGEFHGCSRRPQDPEKGKLSDAVVVDVLIKKYLPHLPLPAGPPKITQIVKQ